MTDDIFTLLYFILDLFFLKEIPDTDKNYIIYLEEFKWNRKTSHILKNKTII